MSPVGMQRMLHEMDNRDGCANILIVDDDPTIRNVLQRWFVRRGFSVTVARDGAEAVQLCRTASFDVVTMDLEMPRMNGIDATRIIKRENPDLPVIVVTGYARGAEALRGEMVETVLVKPVRMADIEAVVRAVLDRVRRSSQSPESPEELCAVLP